MKPLLANALICGFVLLLGCSRSRDLSPGAPHRPTSSGVGPSASTTAKQELPTEPTTPPPSTSATPGSSITPLPESLATVLPEVVSKSHVPVLLPTELPKPIAEAKHSLVDKADAKSYAISLYYELGIGNAGFAATFASEADPSYHPQDFANVSEVKLSRDIRGYFRPVSCGGSCAPANLWWEENGALYQIQIELSPNVSEDDQQKTVTTTADSSIVAGPR